MKKVRIRKIREKRVIPERIEYSTMIVVPLWVQALGLLFIPATFGLPFILPVPKTVTGTFILLIVSMISVMIGFTVAFRTVTEKQVAKNPDKFEDVG